MEQPLAYRLSLGFTLVLTLAAFITLMGWFGNIINGIGHLPAFRLVPWATLGLVALAGINCTVRARLIVRKKIMEQ